ncbi:MAG: hypothetical protein EOO27_00970 [Comamonadaceae bacterium]|nr:MAG: hypothetical protein EOO27_00970 [Comamonadaceae bacterium]
MPNLRAIALAAFFACTCTVAAAQLPPEQEALFRQMEGTLFVKDHTETVQGRLSACGLEFAALTRDFSTKRGAPVKLVGSYYLRRFDGKPGVFYALKLGIFEGPRLAKPVAPHNAFVRAITGEGPAIKAQRSDSDSPGFALFLGEVDDSFLKVYSGILDENLFVVGFNRKPGQMDVSAEIDLSVQDTRLEGSQVNRDRSPRMVKQFVACAGSLANAR